MPNQNIPRLRVLASCGASGEHLQAGESYDVPGQVSDEDAARLVRMGKAEPAEPEAAADKPKKA